jgi:peptidyl-prolyl cis-trans isomerase C
MRAYEIGTWRASAAVADRFSLLCLVRKSRLVVAVGFVSLWLVSLAATQAEDLQADPVVSKVEGTEIHESDLLLADQDLGPAAKSNDAAARRQQLINYMTDMILAEKLGEAEGLINSTEFKRRYALARKKLLMEMLLDKAGRDAQTEDVLRAAYQQFVSAIEGEPDIRTRHIFFRSDSAVPNSGKIAQERAMAAVRRLRNGEDFAAVLTQVADDSGVQVEGGEVSFGLPVPSGEYAQVAHKLKIGEVSDPVKTDAGWYVIRLEQSRPRPVPSFEAMKEQLARSVARSAHLDFLKRLRANAQIE